MLAHIGSFTSSGGRGITSAQVEPTTGALRVVHTNRELADPSYLTADPDGGRLYAVSQAEAGAAAAFRLVAGLPELLGSPVGVDASRPAHLAISDGHLLTANYNSGSVSLLRLAPDGSLVRGAGVLQHEGHGPDVESQDGPHAHWVHPDPSGRWILSVDLGTDSVRVCNLDVKARSLSVHREVRLPPGTGPRHLVFHPNARCAYVIGELNPTITTCRWDATTGTLEPLNHVSLLPGEVDRIVYPSGITISPDGRFLYAAIRIDDTISVLALGETATDPALVADVPCGGTWPRALTLDPAGARLYVANEHSGDVTWFDVDRSTGVPHRAGALAAPAASCVVFT